ncbi:MAG: hypothetical protein V8Q75_05925 [Bacilli bacterium]
MTTDERNDTRSMSIVLFVLQLFALNGVIEEINLLNVVYFIIVNYGAIRYYISNRCS